MFDYWMIYELDYARENRLQTTYHELTDCGAPKVAHIPFPAPMGSGRL